MGFGSASVASRRSISGDVTKLRWTHVHAHGLDDALVFESRTGLAPKEVHRFGSYLSDTSTVTAPSSATPHSVAPASPSTRAATPGTSTACTAQSPSACPASSTTASVTPGSTT
ncbi:MAG: hypothetical protein ACI8PZ_004264, partial [Myxococcota bacterium]